MPAHTSPAATQAAGHGGVGFGPRVEKVSSRLVHGRPPHWLHVLLFSRRTTGVESRHTGGHTSHLGPFGPCRRPGPRCDPAPARARPAMHGKGDFAACYYVFSAREGGRVLGAHRPGAEPMGRPLVTVRELGALGPSGVCQNGPTRTVLSAAQTAVPTVPPSDGGLHPALISRLGSARGWAHGDMHRPYRAGRAGYGDRPLR